MEESEVNWQGSLISNHTVSHPGTSSSQEWDRRPGRRGARPRRLSLRSHTLYGCVFIWFAGCIRPWYELKRDAGPSPGLRGKNGTFSEKSAKKGSQNGVRVYRSLRYDLLVFSSFSGIPENPSWNDTSGKRGWSRRICSPQKSLKSVKDVQTDTSRLKPWVAEKEAPSAQKIT